LNRDVVVEPLLTITQASIGFSIPITSLFEGSLLWRGFVYTALMTVAKLVCGAWLMPLKSMSSTINRRPRLQRLVRPAILIGNVLRKHFLTFTRDDDVAIELKQAPVPEAHNSSCTTTAELEQIQRAQVPITRSIKPRSLYPATVLGFAMVSRGEIGFLISSIAESAGIWRTDALDQSSGSVAKSSDIFIVVTWAIVICTFVGPVAVGLIVRRVRRLEKDKGPAKMSVLGSWGVSSS
jgi:hypothetical protein